VSDGEKNALLQAGFQTDTESDDLSFCLENKPCYFREILKPLFLPSWWEKEIKLLFLSVSSLQEDKVIW
jgi:hypothetical protein